MSNPLNLLLPSEQPRPDRWRWGTIWSLSPLRVRLDGDTEPLEGTPSRLVTYLAIGSRVYVHLRQGQTPVIAGVAGGDSGGVILLDDRALSGDAYVARSNNRLTIPAHLQGSVKRYEIIFSGGFSGVTSIRAVSVWFNNDDQANYRSYGHYVGTSDSSYTNNATAYPRSLYAQSQLGSARLNLLSRAPGWIYWDGSGYYSTGATVGGTFTTGGRWNGPTSVLSTINIGATLLDDTWVGDSNVQLWGYL